MAQELRVSGGFATRVAYRTTASRNELEVKIINP